MTKGQKTEEKIDRKLWALCFIHTDVSGKFFLTSKIHSKRPALHDIRNLFSFMKKKWSQKGFYAVNYFLGLFLSLKLDNSTHCEIYLQ